jgi:uncharacterized protein DUF6542
MTDPAGERTPRRGPSRPGAGAGAPAAGGRVRDRPTRGGSSATTGARSAGRTRTVAAPEPEPARGDTEAPVRGPGGRWPMAERSIVPTVLGVPPLAGVGLAAALTAIGVVVDLTINGGLGVVFTICYAGGSVLAAAWVRRSEIFWPIVQPPLLAAVSVPAVVLLAGSPQPGQGLTERLLVGGTPLVNAFPVMASTTGAVLLVGLLRALLQRPLSA